MKAKLTAFVSELSGKSGDAVAATWKGIQVIRRRVVPKNPQSAAQTTHRNRLARMAAWWRSLPSNLRDLVDALAVGQKMSGFNLSTKQNLDDLVASATPTLVPGNPDIDAVQSVADASSATDKEIDITWVLGAALSTSIVHALTCPVDPDEVGLVEPDAWTYHSSEATTAASGSMTVTVENIAKDYYVVLLVADDIDLADATVVSGGVAVTATSGETP